MFDRYRGGLGCCRSEPMADAAKQRVAAKSLSNVECLVLDMQDLSSIDAGSVDIVSSAHAFPFSPDKPKMLAEALRVLRPGGVFGAVAWVSFELLPFDGAMMAPVTGKPMARRACRRALAA